MVQHLKDNLSNAQGSAQAAVVNLDCAQGAMEKVTIPPSSSTAALSCHVMLTSFKAMGTRRAVQISHYGAEFKACTGHRAIFMEQVYHSESRLPCRIWQVNVQSWVQVCSAVPIRFQDLFYPSSCPRHVKPLVRSWD